MPVLRIVPNLRAETPAAAGAFYADVLGMEVVMDHGWITTFAAPGDRGVQLSVMGDDASAPVAPAVSIEVDDVDAVHAEAVRRGLETVHPLTDEPWGVRRIPGALCPDAVPGGWARDAQGGARPVAVRDPTGAVVNVLGHP